MSKTIRDPFLAESESPTEIDGSQAPERKVRRLEERLPDGHVVANRYRVERLLGRGGFGEVYRVRDQRDAGRPLALKAHRLEESDATALETLQGEFALLSSLSHPNLCAVHDFGIESGGIAFFTQSIVIGERLDRVALDVGSPQGVHLVAQLCRAIDYLHSKGILHGDIKPANVLVDLEREHLTLLDFGVARGFDAIGGHRAGTTTYMSPEAMTGAPVDARSDLYSLGVTLYRIAAGRSPFDGPLSDVVVKKLVGEIPAPDPKRVPKPVGDVIMRLLRAAPAERYASASEVLAALASATGVRVEADTGDTLASYVLSPRYVGDWSLIERLFEQTRDSKEWRSAVVVGEAGTGKSRFLRELRERFQLAGVPWIGFDVRRALDPVSFFQELGAAVVTPGIAAQLSRDDRTELARALPELRDPGEEIAIAVDPERSLALRIQALVHALAISFRDRAGVLAVEDMHWAAPEVVRLLWKVNEIAASLAVPGLLVVTGRPDGPVEELSGAPSTERVECAPLDENAAEQLVESMFGDASILDGTDFKKALAEAPHSALWVQETLRLAIEERRVVRRDGQWHREANLPALPLADVLLARVRGLPRATWKLAVAGAILGRPSAAPDLAAVGDAPIDQTAAGLRELIRRGLAEERRDGRGRALYAMHDRFVDVLMEASTHGERLAAHRRAASWLAKASAGDWGSLSESSRHSLRSGDREEALATLRRAATEADRAGQPEVATRLVTREQQLSQERRTSDVVELLLRRHDFAKKAGMRGDVDDCMRALARVRRKARQEQRVEIALRMARANLQQGRAEAARRRCAAAGRAARALGMRRAECQAALLGADIEGGFGQIEAAVDAYKRAAALSAKRGDRAAEATAWLGASLMALHLGQSDTQRSAAERAVKASRELGDRALLSEALRHLGSALRDHDLARAADIYRSSILAARNCGSPEHEAKALNNLGTVAQSLGQVDEAIESYARSIRLKERIGAATSALTGHNNLGSILTTTGHHAEARREFEIVISAESRDSPLIVGLARTNLGDLLTLQEDLDGAIACYRAATDAGRERAVADFSSHALAGLVRALAMRRRGGDLEEAREIADSAEAQRAFAASDQRRLIHAVLAVLADAEGHALKALEHTDRALELDTSQSDFSGPFGTYLESLWMRAILLERLGRTRDAVEQTGRATAALERLAKLAGEGDARSLFTRASPMYRAILRGDRATPRGWSWRPRASIHPPDH